MQKEQENLCPLRFLTKVFSGKWKIPIICILANKSPQRYSSIRRKLKEITDVMLAQSLREMEADNLISRHQYNEIPPRVEYSLTEKGRSSLTFLTEAAKWAIDEMHNQNLCPNCEKCSS